MNGRIWLAANQGEVGGGEIMLHHIATALRELGRDVGIVAPAEPAETADRLAADGFPVERLAGAGRAGYMRALRRWHRARREDVVWCNGLLPSVALAGRAGRIVHLHQVPRGAVQRVLIRAARARALALLVPSEYVARAVPGSRVLHNWVPDPARGRPHPRARDERGSMGYLGRLSLEKGVVTFLEALADGRFSARVAGEARFVEERERAAVEGAFARAGSHVRRVGWQEPREFLDTVDVLVVPSLVPESFGLVAAEAMAARVPVVVSDAGALPEVVGRDHPHIFPAGDVEVLRERIAAAMTTDQGFLVEAQRERWERCFSPQAGRAALAHLLDDLKL